MDIILYSLTCGSVYLLAFLGLSNPGKVNAIANKWLALLFFSFGCTLLDRILSSHNSYLHYPHLAGLTELTSFAMAPAIYLSIIYFTSPGKKLSPTDFLHFIPLLLFLLYRIPFIFQSSDTKLYLFTHPPIHRPNPYFGAFMFYAIKIQVVVYWGLAYIKLRKHQKNIQLIASATDRINLNWLKNFLLALICMVFLWFNELFFKIEIVTFLTPAGYLIGVYIISYFLLWQEEIFPYPFNEQMEINEIIQESDQATAVRRQRLSAEELEKIKAELQYRMQTEKLFLDPALGLPQLASRMNITSHELSFVLNEGVGTNFFQFINSYRVEEAKRLLLSERHRHLSMVGIAYEAGFSSKTTFNTTFKKATGLSPTQFQQTAQKHVQ